jgi:hypothetical protein
VILLARVMGHCVFQRNTAEDVSALLQMWGTALRLHLRQEHRRAQQGMWGLGGWARAVDRQTSSTAP